MTSSTRRRALFAIEGVWCFVFLGLSYFLIHLPLRITTCAMNHGKWGIDKLPSATHGLFFLLPEDAWAGLGLMFGCCLGFAWLASVSNESLSSRVFRWSLAVLAFALVAATIPLLEMHTCLCYSNYDASWLDETLCFSVGTAALIFGKRYASRHQ